MLSQTGSLPRRGLPVQQDQTESATLTTARLAVSLPERDGNLIVKTVQGETLMHERPNLPRTYLPSNAPGLYHIEDRFGPDATEALYGLGQHQSGMFNYRGSVVELGQNNTDVAIPLLVSSKGYAILWNTASFSYVDNRFPLELNLESMAAPQIDYYVLYGPQMDSIIHLYRSMTGHVPLFPEWAYGFFQSKDRYKTQAEILSVAAGYRSRHIPLDAIVQDWFWWKPGGKGDPVFNSGYTDVPAELKTLHDEHVHAMISAWAMMDHDRRKLQNRWPRRASKFPARMSTIPTNPAARDFFWNQFVGKLFAQGWDAFWLDSSEPEEAWPHIGDAILRDKQLHIGSGLEYTNVFPFEHTGGVAQHWKQATEAEARLPAHAFGLHGPAAHRRHGLVRRRLQQLVGAAPPGARGPQLCALRLSLLDHRHRRLSSPIAWPGRHSPPIRNSTRAGSSTAHSAPSSAPTAIATTTSCGPTIKSFPRCWPSIACATGCCLMSIRWRGR